MPQSENLQRRNEISKEVKMPFAEILDKFEDTVGSKTEDLPSEITEKWLGEQLTKIVKDHHIGSFNEQYFYNELLYRRASLQRQKDLSEQVKAGKKPNSERLKELIVADQAVTYHAYFRSGVNHVLSVMRRYEKTRSTMSHVPPAIISMEIETQRYMEALQSAVQERVAFSNVLLLDQHVKTGFGNDAIRLKKLQDGYMGQLTNASKQSLGGDVEQKMIRANQLNQRIIDVLAGRHGLQGIKDGYVPKQMYLELLKIKYKQLIDEQKEIAVDSDSARAKAELKLLTLKYETVKTTKKGEFTAEDVARSEQLRKRIQDSNARWEEVGERRTVVIEEILGLTDELAVYNLEQTELSDIQNQLGKKYSFEGVAGISPLTTPAEVRDAIAANMEIRKKHHLTQMSSFTDRIENDVLNVGVGEIVEDSWNNNGRKVLRNITHRLSEFFTFAVPETFGMNKAAKDSLTEPLDEAMGWPAGKEEWKDLTEDEKEKVRKNAKSVLDMINNFDKSKIKAFRETISITQGMPSISNYTLEDVKFDENDEVILPNIRVTTSNRDALIKKYGGGTVHLMLMKQLHGDWGTGQPPTGLFGEYAKFLNGVDEVVDVHLEVGRALNILGDRYMDLSKWMLYAVLAALGIGVILGAGLFIAKKVTGRSIKAILHGVRNFPQYAPRVGFASVFAYRAYLDYQKIGEISENIKMQKDQIIAELKGAGFIADPPGQDSTFRYKSGGTEIKVNVSELGDALGGQETAQSVRAGGSLAQAALILRYGAGRAFLPVFVAEVIVETLKYRIDQKSDREFLLRAPAWLIAKINLENAIGETGYSMLAKASGEMMSDNLLGDDAEGSKENKEKRDIREKMLFQILMGELREFPELRQDVLGGNSTHPIRLDLFYRKDFKDTFLPVFYARLFESVAKGKLSWKEVTKGQIDSDWNIPIPRLDSVSSSLSPKITLVQLRNAMRESIVFYVQHAREKDYLSALQERSAIEVQIKKNGNPELEAKKKYLDSIITELGKREVFGKKLSSVPKWGDRVKTGTTRASSVAKLLFAGAPKYDHRVKADTVPGLPDGFSFGSNGTIYSHLLLQEPALRTQLNQVIPKTNNEPEGLMYPPIFSIDRFSLPTGHDSVNANFVAAHSVANGVSDAVGLPRMRDKMFGTSDTREAALKRITDGSVLLFASERNKRSQFMRNETLESSLGYYGSKLNKPIVIKKGYRTNKSDMKNFDKLTKMLSDPNNYADSDFDVSKMVAVCFEGKTLPNGHQIVMATYIFGDISSRSDDRPRFYVMQRAAGTSATSNSTTRTSGLNHASGGARFLKQKGASDMLDAVAKELIEKEKQRDAARIKQEAIRRAQMTEWERGKPIRDQKQALQDKIVSAAEERARKIGSNFGYVPGRYIRDEKKEQFRISGNNYQTRYGKWIIKLVPDNIEGVAQMKAAPDKNEKRGFKFSAWNMDTKKSFNFIVDISDLNPDSPKGSMTKEDVYIAREAITTPLNIAGEPREKNKHFVEKVSEYELRRVLSIAKYKGSYRWNADEFRGNLESELLPYYRDAKNKQKFLDTLVDNLIKHSPVSGGITSSTYDTILENMKKKF